MQEYLKLVPKFLDVFKDENEYISICPNETDIVFYILEGTEKTNMRVDHLPNFEIRKVRHNYSSLPNIFSERGKKLTKEKKKGWKSVKKGLLKFP